MRDPRKGIGSRPALTQAGPYRIDAVLGRGGMGLVYKAFHEETGAPVALKIVHSDDPALLAALRREVHALSRLQHPGIVRIVGQGVANDLPFYAMELLTGRTFRRYLEGDSPLGPTVKRALRAIPSSATTRVVVPPAQEGRASIPSIRPTSGGKHLILLPILAKLCRSLAFLHGNGIVHRDLKPENVFVQDDGSPVLVDFGIAVPFGGREDLDLSTKVGGTFAYMAPEQIRGELADARADLYAVGCLLYEAMTGVPPFTADNGPSILYQHLHSPVIAPSRRSPGIPHELDDLVLRLLAKKPEDRLGYAEDVARCLENAVSGEAAPPSGETSTPYLYRPSFVGRSELVTRIKLALERARSGGAGEMILMGGESGAGKTRLALEMARAADKTGLGVVTSAGRAVGAVPLELFRPALRLIAEHCSREGIAATRMILGDRVHVLRHYEPSLDEVPGMGERKPLPLTSPKEARARVLRSVRETLVIFAATTPLLLVLDDLQWADDLSLALLAELGADATPRRGLVVLGTHRLDESRGELSSLLTLPGMNAIELPRLQRESIKAMVGGMLSMSDPPSALVDLVDREASGNPFFVAEYLRTAMLDGLLTRSSSTAWSLRDLRPSQLPLPHSLAELIERRLKGLDPDARAMVEAGSVLGRAFESDLLLSVIGVAESAAMDSIEQLRARQIFEEGDDGRLRFVHDSIRETTYAKMPTARATRLHDAAASALLGQGEASTTSHAALGHHLARAGRHGEAAGHLYVAADRARAAHAHGEAMSLYEHALTELELAGSEGSTFHLSTLFENLGDVRALRGQQDSAREAFERGLWSMGPNDALGRARLLRKIGKTWETQHQHDRALASYSAAEAELGSPADSEREHWHEWVEIRIQRISANYWRADTGEMKRLVDEVAPVVERRGTALQRVTFYQPLIQHDLRRDRYVASRETVRRARAALAAAEELKDEQAASTLGFGLATVLYLHDDFAESEPRLNAAAAEAERMGDLMLEARCRIFLAMLLRRLRKVDALKPQAERCLAIASEAKIAEYVGAANGHLAWIAWMEGRLDEAFALGKEALSAWKHVEYDYPFQWTALLPLAAVHHGRGEGAVAVELATGLLGEKQQRLPEALSRALRDASVKRPPSFAPTLEAARDLGFL